MGKIWTYVIPKYANYRSKYQAIAFRCLARLKAQAKIQRKKFKKFQVKDKQPATFAAAKEEPEAESNKIEVDISLTFQIKNLE